MHKLYCADLYIFLCVKSECTVNVSFERDEQTDHKLGENTSAWTQQRGPDVVRFPGTSSVINIMTTNL